MSVFSAAMKTLHQQVGSFLRNDVAEIEGACYERVKEYLQTFNLQKYEEFSQVVTQQLENSEIKVIENTGILIRKYAFEYDPELYKRECGVTDQELFDLPLFKQTHQISANGIAHVTVPLKNFVSMEEVLDYTNKYKELRDLRNAEIPPELTYTQMLSMFPLAGKIWEGPTPPLRVKELSNFEYRDNHELNNKFEQIILKETVAGRTRGYKLVPSWNYNTTKLHAVTLQEKFEE